MVKGNTEVFPATLYGETTQGKDSVKWTKLGEIDFSAKLEYTDCVTGK
jgi:hypothetical protein